MKSISLDTLYTQLNKHMLLAQSYTEIPELLFLLKGCRLKPYDYVFGKRTQQTILFKSWFDEFGNSLEIKDKKLNIITNDLKLDQNKIISTDLYYGLSLEQVVKISKVIYLCAGLDEDLQEETFFITLLGLDNYLRSYLYIYGEWQQISSLLLGIKNLKILARHTDMQYFRTLSNKENWPVHCLRAQEWLSILPMSQILIADIKKQSEKLVMFLGLNNET
jgi:hypothetical protein